MKRVGKPVFFVLLVLILAFSAATFFGVSTHYGDTTKTYIKSAQDIRWGIDIRGGVDVTFSPPPGYDATDDDMHAAESIIKVRMLGLNIADYEIYTDLNKDRIIVRFPWKEGESDFNPEAAIKELGETAMLTFRDGGVEIDPETGNYIGLPDSAIILQGKDVVRAEAGLTATEAGGMSDKYIVSLALSDEGAAKFAEATTRLVGKPISIWMDDEIVSVANVNEPITDGNAMISGSFTVDQAKSLADKINAGALPFKLHTDNYNTISPSLGLGARDAMIMAGYIVFAIICVFMLLYYRIPGLIACIALLLQVSLIVASITGFFGAAPSFTMTLPGIAGVILSVGFGVDANIISSERIKEEIRAGKTVDGAIENGFERALSAIVDGNVTVMIVSAVLMGAFGPPNSLFARILSPVFFMFGPATMGTIYSFGYTLLMGVIFNMIVGVYITRLMLKSISKLKFMRKPWLYGGAK